MSFKRLYLTQNSVACIRTQPHSIRCIDKMSIELGFIVQLKFAWMISLLRANSHHRTTKTSFQFWSCLCLHFFLSLSLHSVVCSGVIVSRLPCLLLQQQQQPPHICIQSMARSRTLWLLLLENLLTRILPYVPRYNIRIRFIRFNRV